MLILMIFLLWKGVVIQYNSQKFYDLELQQNDQLLDECANDSKLSTGKFVKYFYNQSRKYKELQKYKAALACYFSRLGYVIMNFLHKQVKIDRIYINFLLVI